MKKLLITKDGSPTLYNEEFKETYHSISGAVTEAFEKFVKPALKIVNKDKMNVLDFCFGLGYNTAALIEQVSGVKLFIVGLENDRNIFEKLQELNPQLKYYCFIKRLNKKFFVKNSFFEIKIILGDAFETIKRLKEKFDIVFFDPFSPKKCSKLWGEEVFKNVYKLMNNKGVLTTYSCARIPRENMKKVGFKVMDGPIVGRRGAGTIAVKRESDF